jgi:hypothetical protein
MASTTGWKPADRFLRIEAGDHFGGADDIGEEHGRLLAFAVWLDDGQGCGPRSATPAAKTRCRMATAPTRGADDVQRDAAVRAELAAWRVIGRANGTLHGKLAAYPISKCQGTVAESFKMRVSTARRPPRGASADQFRLNLSTTSSPAV